jgi:hypothetical protein
VFALAVGATAASNALEGGTAALTLTSSAVFVMVGWRTRDGLGRLVLVAYGLAVGILAVYGLWFGGFPQPSTLA